MKSAGRGEGGRGEGDWAEGWFYACHGRSCDFVPGCIELDRGSRTVVLEMRPDAQALGATEPGRALRALAALAAPLARLHELPVGGGAPASRPALPSVCLPLASEVQTSTPALVDCLRDLQGRRRLLAGYERWRSALEADTVIHGDIKLDNIISVGARTELIDWELSGLGDASVDIGAVVGSMVTIWVEALGLSADAPAEEWVGSGALPFHALRAAIADFSHGYGHEGQEWMRAAVRWGAFWLVARVAAEASQSRAYAPTTMLKVRVADSLSRRPDHLLPPNAAARPEPRVVV